MYHLRSTYKNRLDFPFKGEVSPNNNVDWVSRKQFYKPNSKRLRQIWIIHLREVIMQSCVCRPLWMELCQNM